MIAFLLRQVGRTGIGRLPGVPQVWGALLQSRLLSPVFERVAIQVDDVSLNVPPRFWPHFFHSDYEPITRRSLDEHLRPGMTAVDVGAHIGFFASKAARIVGTAGRVLALEPSPENLPFLRRNVARNGLGNVAIHNVAASSETGRRTFNITGSSDSGGFYQHPLTHTVETFVVDTVRLDDLLEGPVDAVKIDVEGAELEVIAGMERVLEENRQMTLWIEWNPSCQREAGQAPELLPHRLRDLGFDVVALDDRAGRVRPVDEVLAEVEAGVPDWWYVNLLARRER